jgi:hypothetical protein
MKLTSSDAKEASKKASEVVRKILADKEKAKAEAEAKAKAKKDDEEKE